MEKIEIRDVDNDRIALSAYYHPDLPDAAKNLGGRWNPNWQEWRFSKQVEGRVRDMCREIFGTDGNDENLVSIRITVDPRETRNNTLWKYGRQIMRRRGRDWRVDLGDAVILVSGKIPNRGGSTKYPEIALKEAIVLDVLDVPHSLLKGHEEII